MDIDEDDDFYADENSANTPTTAKAEDSTPAPSKPAANNDLEDGEEDDDDEEEESDSDLEIITERKDGTKAAPPPSRYSNIRDIPQRTGGTDGPVKVAPVKKEGSAKPAKLPAGGADLPGIATSKVDVNAKPVYEPAGKPITQVNIDEDLIESEKPWRRPGTDVSDYFNYGFDEFTWALYASKQDSLRSEYSPDKVALNNKKMMEDMSMMMMGGGMPGMMPGAGAPAGMTGMEGIPPEMQQMMQQMMQSGMDPSQMDPQAMFAAMSGQQQPAGGVGFGGQGQNQQFGGFDQNMMNQGQDSNRGGRGGFRGKRGRGW